MPIKRIIPLLLLDNEDLIKTIKFYKKTYLGDPVNAIKIFTDKEVDEIILLDINASRYKLKINYELLNEIAGECFVPLCYGGGIKDIDMIAEVLNNGVERVSLNSFAIQNPTFVEHAANKFGSSTILVSIDYKKDVSGHYAVFTHGGTKKIKSHPVEIAKIMEDAGAGELLIQSIDRDGTFTGYDLELLCQVVSSVKIPVIACGGAKDVNSLREVLTLGVSAAAAGSLFLFKGKHRAKLINYPLSGFNYNA